MRQKAGVIAVVLAVVAAGAAQLTIVSPQAGEEFSGPTITVLLELANGEITPQISGSAR
ncbi:MAG: hypothetical protein ACRDFT_09345 [bacterium]